MRLYDSDAAQVEVALTWLAECAAAEGAEGWSGAAVPGAVSGHASLAEAVWD